MNTLTLHSGEIIFRQKDFAESMFDIVSGKVGIFSNYGTDTETKITELGEGQTFGEMGMTEVGDGRCPGGDRSDRDQRGRTENVLPGQAGKAAADHEAAESAHTRNERKIHRSLPVRQRA